MRRLFTHDSLTGLPKGWFFINRFKRYLKTIYGEDTRVAVFYIDVDNFQIINDIYGYVFGDKIIRQIGHRIKSCVNNCLYDDVVAKLGSDEFVIVYPEIEDDETAYQLAYRILREFDIPIICDDIKFYITLSIGIALYPDHGNEANDLLRYANMAMSSVKDEGKNGCALYETYMSERIEDATLLKRDFKHAIGDEQFKLYFHPQIDLASKEIVSLEVLTRWVHPQRGLIYPNDFIPIAEETGLIVPLGDFILQSACEQLKEWHGLGFPGYTISVNISPIQLQHRRFVDKVQDILDETDLDPSYLEFEITENSLIRYIDHTNNTLNQLRDMGIKISLDDFGTGYSSLSYLKNLPVDIIKIDKAFVKSIDNNVERAITNAIIDLGHKMDLCITAEGVETREQFDILKDQGCDRVQGFLFSKPLPKVQIEKNISRIDQQIRAL